MLQYSISVLPILFYLFLLIYLDAFAVIRRQRLITAFAWGAVVCVFLFLLDVGRYSVLMPAAEEVLKFALIVNMLRSGKLVFLADSVIYGATVGAGFALAENCFYIANAAEQMPLMFYVYRGFATSLMHIGISAFAAGVLVVLVQWCHYRFATSHGNAVALLAVTIAIALHYMHNMLTTGTVLSLAVVIAGILIVLMILFYLSEMHVSRWLDKSMAEEARLIAAIKSGNFSGTSAGKYLLSVREQFNALIFFDMLVYVRLSLEVSVAAKGFIMLREMNMPIPASNLVLFREKVAELRSLRSNIGRLGLYALNPIVNQRQLESIVKLF